MNEETKTLATILRHQKTVSYILRELARELERRADLHDSSKLSLDELEGFIEVNRIARKYPFSSKEYNESLKDNQAIALHFANNSHHPEYYKNGVSDMSFVDFLEMICDWKAANLTYGTTEWQDVLITQKARFNLGDCQMETIKLLSEWLDNV